MKLLKTVLFFSLLMFLAAGLPFNKSEAKIYTPYDWAVYDGESLKRDADRMEKSLNEGDIIGVHVMYDTVSRKIAAVEKSIGKVSGKSTRDKLTAKYVKPAKVLRERVIYEVSQMRLLNKIAKSIINNELETAKADLSKLNRLKKRAIEIKKAGGYAPLPKKIDEYLINKEDELRRYLASKEKN